MSAEAETDPFKRPRNAIIARCDVVRRFPAASVLRDPRGGFYVALAGALIPYARRADAVAHAEAA